MTDAPGSPNPRADPLALDLPADPAALVTVRRALARWLVEAGVDPAVGGALQVAVGEACANAVDHAYGPDAGTGPDTGTGTATAGRMQLRVDCGDGSRVTARITDQGSWRTPDHDPGDRGRGLMIMHQLLEDVEVDRSDSGTTVTLRVPVRALPDRPVAAVEDLGGLRIDRTGSLPRVVALGSLPAGAAAAVRLRLLEASRGGMVATELDLEGAPEVADPVAAVVAEVAAIGRANGWHLRVRPVPGPAGEALRRAGVRLPD